MSSTDTTQLSAKRNIKCLYELLRTNYNEQMTLDLFIELLKSDKKLHRTFFNKRTTPLKEKEVATIHPCLVYETDEEAYIPQCKNNSTL